MTTHRIFAHDIPTTSTATDSRKPTPEQIANVRAVQAQMAARTADAEPDSTEMSVEEHEASARALTEANQNPAAIQAWHRAAIAHSKVNNHEGVLASLVHAEHLAGNLDFAPSRKRKPTGADSEPVTGPMEQDRDWDAQVQPEKTEHKGSIRPPMERL